MIVKYFHKCPVFITIVLILTTKNNRAIIFLFMPSYLSIVYLPKKLNHSYCHIISPPQQFLPYSIVPVTIIYLRICFLEKNMVYPPFRKEVKGKMTNNVYHENKQTGKSYLPNPFPAHKITISKEMLQTIMKIKGWKSYTNVAEALGFTRQYIIMIANGIPVSAEFIVRISLALGNQKGNWASCFEISPRGIIHENHPMWNQQKYDEQIPYGRFSIASTKQERDYPVERIDRFPW